MSPYCNVGRKVSSMGRAVNEWLSTFRATMYLDFLSRARYTLPNFPCPRGLPMSKSASCHLLSLLIELAAPLEPARASVTPP